MTTSEIHQYFQYHNSNIKLLKIGFDEIRDRIKNIYKIKNNSGEFIYSFPEINSEKVELRKTEKSLSRILSGIQVSWAEESIKRLLYEPNLFTDIQRDYLLELPALDQRWYKTLKIIFCIAYDLVPMGDEICNTIEVHSRSVRNNIGDELVDQYKELKSIIKDFLVPNFSIRNKVQHGEWEYAFWPQFSKEFSLEITEKISRENIVTTTSRYTLVNAFYQMLVDLGRFKSNSFAIDSMLTPFEYFYKNYIRKIKFEMEKISNPNLEKFIEDIVNKEIRGISYRIASHS